jgi:phosphoenolpyruvate phosphomutase / 2-hydroxyethylphosphonate cytidylyltransferase
MEIHTSISGLIVEKTQYKKDLEFDGMCSSSLTDSTSRGKPDIKAVDVTARVNAINEAFEVTTKPII